jgi:hypothetical protein
VLAVLEGGPGTEEGDAMNALEVKRETGSGPAHNRRPIQQSIKRLNHRRRRRDVNASWRRILALMAAHTVGGRVHA